MESKSLRVKTALGKLKELLLAKKVTVGDERECEGLFQKT